MSSISFESITNAEGIKALEAEWEELGRSRGGLPLPLTHKWFTAWWDCFGKGASPCVLRFTDAGQVIAVAPFMVTRQRYRGVAVRKQKLMANGHSPYCGIIFHGETSDAQLRDVLQIIVDSARNADILELCGLAEDSTVLYSAIGVAKSSQRDHGIRHWLKTPVILVGGSFSEFFGQRSKKFRKGMRGKVNKFHRKGLRVENVPITPCDSSLIGDMIQVSRNSWKRTIGNDLDTNTSSRKFIESLVEHFGNDGNARLWIARDGDIPIAYEIHIQCEGVTYPVRADFDENYRDYSPGSVVEFTALKDIFDGGNTHTYYSCADDYRYLAHWTNTVRDVRSLEIFGRGLKPTFLHALEYRMMPLARRIFGKGKSNAE